MLFLRLSFFSVFRKIRKFFRVRLMMERAASFSLTFCAFWYILSVLWLTRNGILDFQQVKPSSKGATRKKYYKRNERVPCPIWIIYYSTVLLLLLSRCFLHNLSTTNKIHTKKDKLQTITTHVAKKSKFDVEIIKLNYHLVCNKIRVSYESLFTQFYLYFLCVSNLPPKYL